MENNAHKCENAFKSFEIHKDFEVTPRPEPNENGEKKYEKSILLVDDTVDSRFTLTVCGYRLYEAGFDSVTPFALATKE
jgi:ATP-dependent DNA helicase RecQ